MEYIKRIWLMSAWRDEADHIWTDDWSFRDELSYRIKHKISMNQDRDFVKEE